MTHTPKSASPWREEYAPILSPEYAQFITDEQQAVHIEVYESRVIPGLLQTEAYGRAADAAWLERAAPEYANKLLALRLKRQWELFDRSKPPHIHYLIDESLLYRPFGGQEVLHAQLMHLQKLAKQSFILLQVMSFGQSAVWPVYIAGSFTLMHDAGAVSQLHVAVGRNEAPVTDTVRIEQHKAIFASTALTAATPEDSLALIAAAIAKLDIQDAA